MSRLTARTWMRFAAALEPNGFRFRHVAGVDMFVDANARACLSAVHLVFAGRASKVKTILSRSRIRFRNDHREGFLIAPVVDLVHMKLTSYRLKDQVHIQDLDHAGLITPEIEQTLSPALLTRLKEVRSKR